MISYFSYIESQSEILAYLHQIKLYFHHKLADRFAEARVPTPAKVNPRCVRLSFDEMRRDGFADDGLFDQMEKFFLALTMVEQDLAIDERRWRSIAEVRRNEKEQLLAKQDRLFVELNKRENEYYDHYVSIRKLRKDIGSQRRVSIGEDGERYEAFPVPVLIEDHQIAMERLEPVRTDLRTQLHDTKYLIDNIEQTLNEHNVHSGRHNERDLIKPNRGFIMYGPPG